MAFSAALLLIQSQIEAARSQTLPKSALAKACKRCSEGGYYAFYIAEPNGFKVLVVATQADVDAISESERADAAKNL
jgi:hypothetical protein